MASYWVISEHLISLWTHDYSYKFIFSITPFLDMQVGVADILLDSSTRGISLVGILTWLRGQKFCMTCEVTWCHRAVFWQNIQLLACCSSEQMCVPSQGVPSIRLRSCMICRLVSLYRPRYLGKFCSSNWKIFIFHIHVHVFTVHHVHKNFQ